VVDHAKPEPAPGADANPLTNDPMEASAYIGINMLETGG
jgi:hypothetical protein